MIEEKIEYWHNPIVPDIELSKASFQHFEFDQHIHLDYHIGVVTQGGQKYQHKGESYHLGKGCISTLNPDEAHNGQSVEDEGYQANVMSIPISYVNQITSELNIKEQYFSSPLSWAPDLHQAFLHLHRNLISPYAKQEQLQIETSLMAFTTELFERYGSVKTLNHQQHALSYQQVVDIKSQFHDEMHNVFQLDDLAAATGLSKFQFLRQFKAATGMTPHAYLKRIRLEYAKKALIKGEPIIDIAQQVGFFDQSHLNKAFKKAFLITPSHFQKRVL
ncbi:AraC family transcriptional regulator [Shewanella eurypsychrophilus]|uniref:AraC family transcriptional regulator n=1 Tax=Shewanella eurypsychrophilus TaxID=2593656 RepID=A0ABX8S4A1_9GAMM|nr:MULTISPECIES: AraC family transcriptional regulator [Shewanella]QFU23232.1 helix-turn-helix domain-containing protein [Shewanella sp. YLB-09]QXP44825.1 AraC family transcriptional regulator [Shewanella eurypsychrophilus]